MVAMAGERFRFGRFVEISAVCVAPEFRGREFAAFLIAGLAERLRSEEIIPFLHVFTNNRSAIALYEKPGFSARRGFFVTSMRPVRN
ncbi:GNAT family N-acetyltransferase [Rhizobium sp. CNPSo 4039]|uniref:GNAT family N-acetyltransferase n=1 Tax=Rhizobium sp. CNPSo 4039 TaxID=3021409 RepID=UPI0033068A10